MKIAYFLLPALLILVGRAQAQTLTLSHPYEHDGLTFSSPLSFSQRLSTLKPITLTFGASEVISIRSTNEKEVEIETIITPSPSPTLTPTPTLFVTPTSTPTPVVISLSSTPTPTPKPTLQVITSPANPGGLNADVLFNMANSYRASKGLPAFQKDERSCSLAASRAPEVENEVASSTMHSGLRNRNLNYWNTENIISMRNETEAFNWWINDQIHKEAIESNNTYSCVACSGNSCAQEFTNYQPK